MALTPAEKTALKAEAARLKSEIAAMKPTISQIAAAELIVRDGQAERTLFHSKKNRLRDIALLIWEDEN